MSLSTSLVVIPVAIWLVLALFGLVGGGDGDLSSDDGDSGGDGGGD